MTNTILVLKNVSKKIKHKKILNDISFELHSGEIVGLIGANGAGKTSLLRLIVGLASTTAGKIEINQFNIEKKFKQAMAGVGALIETPDFYNHLTGFENLKLFSTMLSTLVTDEDMLDILTKVGLLEQRNHKVASYSLGMRQRLGIALTLLGKPKLLLLDEPLNGIDPTGILEIKKLLEDLSASGTTILISSHQLSELESFCTKYIMLAKGNITKKGFIHETTATDLTAPLRYLISTSDNAKAVTLLKSNDVTYKNNNIQVTISISDLNIAIKRFGENNILIYQLTNIEGNLEHLFQLKGGPQS